MERKHKADHKIYNFYIGDGSRGAGGKLQLPPPFIVSGQSPPPPPPLHFCRIINNFLLFYHGQISMTKHVSKACKVDPGDRVTLPVKFACKPERLSLTRLLG